MQYDITIIAFYRTIIYELMLLEYPYKSVPLETQIWRIGRGDLQALTLVPKGRLRSIISRCWEESPQRRPIFKDLLARLEQDVSRRGEGRDGEGRRRKGGRE